MAGAYEAMRFLEIVLAGLRVATLTPRIYPSPFADRPSRHRSGACRKQAQIHEGHTILLGSSAGAPRTLARMIMNFFRMLNERPTKKSRDYWSACRRHTCCPLSPERKIRHFRLKGNFGQNTSFLVAEKGPRPIEQLGHIVARA
jgi:hypothetical protein